MGTLRWNLQTERMAADAIRDAERRTREALLGFEPAEFILAARSKRGERTRAAGVERLAQAVRALQLAAAGDPRLAGQAAKAMRCWEESEALAWGLAMSARQVVEGEVRKLVTPLVEQEDLCQEGYIGLIRAARRFDPERGIRFTTYARWWVRAQMTRAIELTGRMVRLPGGAIEQLRNLRLASEQRGMYAVKDDISALARHTKVGLRRAELLLSTGTWVSLDQPDVDGLGILDRMTPGGDERRQPDAVASQEQALRRLRDGLDGAISTRERFILARRYGIDDLELATVANIGAFLGLSRERVRQIEHETLDRLRLVVEGTYVAPTVAPGARRPVA